jgi:hypothetical protein
LPGIGLVAAKVEELEGSLGSLARGDVARKGVKISMAV